LKALAGSKVVTAAKEDEGPDDRRDSRFISTSSMLDDDHGNSKQRSGKLPIPKEAEVEEVTFECMNCSG